MPFIKTGDSQPVTYYDNDGKELKEKDLKEIPQESSDKTVVKTKDDSESN